MRPNARHDVAVAAVRRDRRGDGAREAGRRREKEKDEVKGNSFPLYIATAKISSQE